MTDVVKILRAFKPGDIVVVECAAAVSAETSQRIKDAFHDTGLRVMILDRGMRLAAAEETRQAVPE